MWDSYSIESKDAKNNLYLFGDKSITLHHQKAEFKVDIVSFHSGGSDVEHETIVVAHSVDGQKLYIPIRNAKDKKTLKEARKDENHIDYESLNEEERRIADNFDSRIPFMDVLYEEYKEVVAKYYNRFPSGHLYVKGSYKSSILLQDNSDNGYYEQNYIYAVDLCNGDKVIKVGWDGWDSSMENYFEDWEYADLYSFNMYTRRENMIELMIAMRSKLSICGDVPPHKN